MILFNLIYLIGRNLLTYDLRRALLYIFLPFYKYTNNSTYNICLEIIIFYRQIKIFINF